MHSHLVSTSTEFILSFACVAEGEDVLDDDLDDDHPQQAQTALPIVPQTMKPEQHKPAAPAQTPSLTPTTTTTASFITQHISIQHKASVNQPQLLPVTPPQPASKPAASPTLVVTTSNTPTTPSQPLIPAQTQVVATPSLHPTVIAHASVSHPSVIQAVNHVIQGGGPKHIAHLAPSNTSSVQLAPRHQPIGHITVHPVAHLSPHLPALYPQPVAVTQPTVVGHITHTINHAHPQVNGTTPSQAAAAIVSKQTAVSAQMVAHHPQLMGQTVLNPVTMVTMPSFPISTLKLAWTCPTRRPTMGVKCKLQTSQGSACEGYLMLDDPLGTLLLSKCNQDDFCNFKLSPIIVYNSENPHFIIGTSVWITIQ